MSLAHEGLSNRRSSRIDSVKRASNKGSQQNFNSKFGGFQHQLASQDDLEIAPNRYLDKSKTNSRINLNEVASQGGGLVTSSNGGLSVRNSKQVLFPLPNLKSDTSKMNILGSAESTGQRRTVAEEQFNA